MSCKEVQLPLLEHSTPFTQPTIFYNELHCNCCDSFVEKTKWNSQEGCWDAGASLSAACKLGEQQEEALHDQGHKLKHCPVPLPQMWTQAAPPVL